MKAIGFTLLFMVPTTVLVAVTDHSASMRHTNVFPSITVAWLGGVAVGMLLLILIRSMLK